MVGEILYVGANRPGGERAAQSRGSRNVDSSCLAFASLAEWGTPLLVWRPLPLQGARVPAQRLLRTIEKCSHQEGVLENWKVSFQGICGLLKI